MIIRYFQHFQNILYQLILLNPKLNILFIIPLRVIINKIPLPPPFFMEVDKKKNSKYMENYIMIYFLIYKYIKHIRENSELNNFLLKSFNT